MEENRLHNVIMEKRERLTVSGVKDLGVYNEELVELSTVMGLMTVKGENLHINKFNTEDGELKVEGTVYSIDYGEEKTAKGGFWSGLFK